MDKLRVGFFKGLGGVLASGDNVSFQNGINSIESFAPRLNSTGMQPCGDDMPVVVDYLDESESRLAGMSTWQIDHQLSDITYWKPDLEALIKLQNDADNKMDKLTSSDIFWLDDDVCALIDTKTNQLLTRYSFKKKFDDEMNYIVTREEATEAEKDMADVAMESSQSAAQSATDAREPTEAEKDMADGALSFLFNKQSDPWTNLLAMVKESQLLHKAMQEECERADNNSRVTEGLILLSDEEKELLLSGGEAGISTGYKLNEAPQDMATATEPEANDPAVIDYPSLEVPLVYTPEVGEECYLIPDNHEWGFSSTSKVKGVVECYVDDWLWFREADCKGTLTRADKVTFKPIETRTPEQVQVEEVAKALALNNNTEESWKDFLDDATELQSLGLLKELPKSIKVINQGGMVC